MTTRHTCPACDGKRIVTVRLRKMHGGERCGKEISINHPCKTCMGAGFVLDDIAASWDRLAIQSLADNTSAAGSH